MIQTKQKAPSRFTKSQREKFLKICQRSGLTWEQGIIRLVENAIREDQEDQK